MTEQAQQESTAIQISPKHMGDRGEIDAVKRRLLNMMPGATTYPVSVLYAAAQLAVAYRLDPFNGEIYIAKMGREKDAQGNWNDRYVPMIGIKGFRTLARRASHYVIEQPIRAMNADEVKGYRADMYDEEDVGVELRLFRLDVASQCQAVGIAYHPVVGRGFWRKRASERKDKNGNHVAWIPDNVPETWTRQEVAEKRAEKLAITKAFDLRVPLEQMADENFDFDAQMDRLAEDRERETAIMQRPETTIVEEDGDILYAK